MKMSSKVKVASTLPQNRDAVIYHSVLVFGLTLSLTLALSACEGSTETEMSAGEMSAGEMSAGEMSAGEMSAGEMSAGEMSAGEMSAGEMSAGEMSAGENIGPMCSDASECPVPPPIALVECEEDWVVEVIFTPLCVDGQCDMERSTRQQRDCSAEGRICRDGECLTPPMPTPCDRETPCGDGQLCVYDEGLCGALGFSPGGGVCQAVPQGCTGDVTQACGCDGQSYSNTCTARSMGVDVSRFGGCVHPDDATRFTCDQQSCDAGTYCAIFMNDIAGPDQPEYTADCVSLPSECLDATSISCDTCFMPDLFSTCAEVGEQLIVVYPGG